MSNYEFSHAESSEHGTYSFAVQVTHPLYTTEAQLADWLDRLEVRSDLGRWGGLIWSTPSSTSLTQPPEMIIRFIPDDSVEVTAVDRFTRAISFLNARDDDERMQLLLDILINCWAEQGMVAIDLNDVYAILEASERGVITSVEAASTLPNYCANWSKEVAPLLGVGKLTSLQCIYREYELSMANFSRFNDEVEGLVEEEGVFFIGVLHTEKPSDRQNAVLYLGI